MPDRFDAPDADADDLDDTGIDAVDEDPWGDEDDGDERLGLDGGAAVGRAPICGFCGVTMLPADPALNESGTHWQAKEKTCVKPESFHRG